MAEETELQRARRAREESAWQALADCCCEEPRWDIFGFASLVVFILSVFTFFLSGNKKQSLGIGGSALVLCFVSACCYCVRIREQGSPAVAPLDEVLVHNEVGGGEHHQEEVQVVASYAAAAAA